MAPAPAWSDTQGMDSGSPALKPPRVVEDAPVGPFEDLVMTAARLCDAPFAWLSCVHGDTVCFKARTGIAAETMPAVGSPCAQGLRQVGPLLVPDASKDSRFREHPEVAGGVGLRFYAGVQVAPTEACPLGMLAVSAPEPRRPDARLVADLERLARQAVMILDGARARAAERTYLQMLDAIQDMVLCKGPNSGIYWANKAFRDYYGMSNEELRDMIDAPFNAPDYTQRYVKDDAYVFESGRTLDIPDEPVTRRDGTVRLFHTVKSPIRDESGRVVMTIGVSRDITERQRMEEAMRVLDRQAVVGRLAAGVAHQINNPLAVILGFSQAARRAGPRADELPFALDSIEREAARCRTLVQRLVAFSRAARGERGRVDLDQAADDALALVATLAKMGGVQLLRKRAEPPLRVRGSSGQLQELVAVLCDNALDAMGGTGTLTVTAARARAEDRDWALLRVADTGPGIPPDLLPSVFEPFVTTKEAGKGVGLGLAMAREIALNHGGRIEAESRAGATEFTLWLPVPEAEP